MARTKTYRNVAVEVSLQNSSGAETDTLSKVWLAPGLCIRVWNRTFYDILLTEVITTGTGIRFRSNGNAVWHNKVQTRLPVSVPPPTISTWRRIVNSLVLSEAPPDLEPNDRTLDWSDEVRAENGEIRFGRIVTAARWADVDGAPGGEVTVAFEVLVNSEAK